MVYQEVEKALKFAEKLGVKEVEIWIEKEKIKELSWREGKEIGNITTFTGVGIRVIEGKKQGLFSFTGFNENLLERGITIAYKIAKTSKKDPFFPGLPEKYEKSNVENIYDKKIEEMDFEKTHELKEKISEYMEFPKGILKAISSQVYLFSFNDKIEEKVTKILATLRAKYGEHTLKKAFSARTTEKFQEGIENFSKRREMLKNFKEPKIINSCKIDVLLMPEIAGAVFKKMLAEQVCADIVEKGKSVFNETEKEIAMENLTLIDSGILPHASLSKTFDGDGLATKETLLVEKGILKSFLHNYYTACIENAESTGNGYRKYNSFPFISPNNLILKEGNVKLEELDNCLFVYKIIGLKQSNPSQGIVNFNVACGFLKKGENLIPVSGVMVYDDFLDIIKNRIEICKGAELHNGFYFPPVLMKNVNIAGK